MVDLAALDVCFVAGTLGPGGAERQLYYIARTLRAHGTRVRILSITQGDFWEAPFKAIGVPIVWIGKSRMRLARVASIVRQLRRDRPTVIQSQHFFTNLYAAAAGRLLGIPTIGAMRNDGTSEIRQMGPFGRASLHAPGLMAVNSAAAIRVAIAMGAPARRLHRLPNVVDTDEFAPVPTPKTRPLTILSIGRLVAQKRMDRLVETVAAAGRAAQIPLRLVVAGAASNHARRQLERRALASGLHEVEMLPPQRNVAALYHDADIFALTSAWEGTPNVLFEAMASGLPVIATRVGGVEEVVVNGKTGILADPSDADAIVEGLSRLIRDRELRDSIGRQARLAMVAERSVARLPGHLRDLYDAVLVSPPLAGRLEPSTERL